MHTIREIIDNQKQYKQQISDYLEREYNQAKKDLKSIKSNNKFILEEKKKLQKKFKKTNFTKNINKLFFMNSSRNEDLYVWWDEQQNEALVLPYGQK